ncbi:ferritin-like domain-containing protein [Embleya sp. NPDC001921]
MTTVLEYESEAIVELMGVSDEQLTVQWLKDALQQAIVLELATLPPYLSGVWSIKERGDVSRAIDSIVWDEMRHFGLACNLLTTIGGTPILSNRPGATVVPSYPTKLPGGVRKDLDIHLEGLNTRSVELFSEIERPEQPLAEFADAYPSIGAFYTRILKAFKANESAIQGTRQVVNQAPEVFKIEQLSDVERAIEIIKAEGEGTDKTPDQPQVAVSLAHYYVFREIFRGRKLVMVSKPEWDFRGDPIAMPDAHPMGRVPKGGWATAYQVDPEAAKLIEKGNIEYSSMLRALESAWAKGSSTDLATAVAHMRKMRDPAVELMRIRLPVQHPLPEPTTYGPEFRYTEKKA